MTKQKLQIYLRKTWKEWRLTIFLIVFVILPVKSSLADFNWVPTGSMKPTILEGDFIFVNKIAYDLRIPFTLKRVAQWSDPERGDIVICFSPDDGTRLVKRVVGLPGDTLAMQNNQLYINDEIVDITAIDPRYLEDLSVAIQQQAIFGTEQLGDTPHAVMSFPQIPARRHISPMTLGPDEYFMMGDNRDCSKDSRFFGVVHRKAIVGQAVGVVGSINITDKFQPRLKRFMQRLQ